MGSLLRFALLAFGGLSASFFGYALADEIQTLTSQTRSIWCIVIRPASSLYDEYERELDTMRIDHTLKVLHSAQLLNECKFSRTEVGY